MKTRHDLTKIVLSAGVVSLTGVVAALSTFVYQLTKRHGQVLFELEQLRSNSGVLATPEANDPRSQLFRYGAPPGSVGMNFELPSLNGTMTTLTQYKGRQVLLIFIAPDCPHSRSMLPALARLPADPSPDQPVIVIISHGDLTENRRIMEQYGIRLPVLVQEQNEVSLLYYISGTPMAYLLDDDGVTELERIEGAQAILGVAFARTIGQHALPEQDTTPADLQNGLRLMPRQAGERLQPDGLRTLDGELLHGIHLPGLRTLLVMFDPLSPPCLDLLPDLARVHHDPDQPDVLLVTRRDVTRTRLLANEYDMPYQIAWQDDWSVSYGLGVLAAPAACVIDSDWHLETDIAVGQQAILALLKTLRRGGIGRRLVSLTSLLE